MLELKPSRIELRPEDKEEYETIKAERAAQQATAPQPVWQQQGPSTKKPTAAQRIGLTQPGRGQQ